ncbi:hypothetical protein SAMN05421805_105106 [Saccharopolyspora antimicrobica]|uniref:Small secreted domain n=1 Tax=Saccharopolyspora antimicrobica TaxID=455193 RepID=A0A1I4ZTH9_9PSEU|nr:hypothetical protein [Saccharopolyspora antimicrobica]RKT83408.1 hypothetical protein ATL45_1691 [Saccharopolyspora antimicrobica]SFN53521.1 hypothetical protein SAMN05421805_105106 [Saccharopolyspora antimicrobica]
MLKKAAVVAGAAAGLLALAPVANADSADNDGINILNDNNASVLPIQACGNNVAVVGAVVPILSPQINHCVNAPIVDHPKG